MGTLLSKFDGIRGDDGSSNNTTGDALANRRRALEEERLELEEQELRLKRRRLEAATRTIVELNVGGEYFTTTKETLLCKGSPYFERLLESGENSHLLKGAQRDSNGRIFIDRPADRFCLILEYMRGCSHQNLLDKLGDDHKMKQGLMEDAFFFQLNELEVRLRLHGGGYDPWFLSPEDQVIRDQAVDIRAGFLEERPDARTKATEALVDLFDPKTGELKITANYKTDTCSSSPEATLIFQKHALYSRKNATHKLPTNLTEFKQRLAEFAGPLFRNFPFENVVVAGGSVFSALLGFTDSQVDGDVDLFLVADTPEQARATYDAIIAHFARDRRDTGIDHNQMLVIRSPFAVTLQVGYPQRNVQIILARHACPAEVIFHFDVDCCQVLYDGTNVRATPSGYRALRTGVNIADPERRAVNYELRLSKYANRGFLAAVPGLDLERVNAKFLKDHIYTLQKQQLREVSLRFKASKEKDEPLFGSHRPEHRRKRPEERVVASCEIHKNEITGLSKLLVLASSFHHTEYLDSANSTGQGSLPFFLSSKQRQQVQGHTFLIHAEELSMRRDIRWKRETPPYPPPRWCIQSLEETKTSTDNNRIIFYDRNEDGFTQPEAIFKEVIERLRRLWREDDRLSRQKEKDPICVCSLLRNVLNSTAREVEDASLIYTRHRFTDEPGTLLRSIQFPAASFRDEGSNPWARLDEAGWTKGTYNKKTE